MKATITAFTLALASLAIAGESQNGTNSTKDGKKFSLKLVKNEHFGGRDGPMAMVHAHLKYAKTLPAQFQKLVETQPELNANFKMLLSYRPMVGTAAAVPAPKVDTEYILPVQIGTPPQIIPMNLDTGSSDLWTLSADTDPALPFSQAMYRPYDSTTAQRLDGQTWEVKYGDGAGASGVVYKDRVQVGNTVFDSQAVQSAIKVSAAIRSDTFSSGILGMANSAVNTVRPSRQLTYFDNIKGQLAEPLFTANLRSRKPGNFNFGYIDQSEFIGNIKYVDIDPRTPFFKIDLTGFRVGSGSYSPLTFESIVDTGTSLLLLPQEVLDSYYSQVDGAGLDPTYGMVVFPCNSDLPDFEFGIGDYRGRIPGHFMKYEKATDYLCYGGLQASTGVPFSVLGDVLLKAQFVVFYYGDKPKVGFANKNLNI